MFWHIKSRYRILYVRGSEENRIINAFKLIAKSEGYDLYQWDCSRGMLNAFSKQQIAGKNNDIHESAEAALHHIVEQAKSDNESMAESATVPTGGHIYMLLDFHHELDSPTIERLFKEFASFSSISHIVIVSPTFVCPIALDKEFTLIDFPPPSRAEVKLSLDKMIKQIPVKFPKALKAARDNMENILHATTGLTIAESENAYAKALIKTKNFDIPSIIEEKEQIIRRGGILECRSPRYTFDQVGGLGELKDWLQLRRLAFEDSAREFGLDAPKGVLLVGIPGTGKSLSADALASLWSFPLVRLDMGALFSAHVGESEENARIAIQTAESIAPCILWIDEIEKGIGGVQSSNYTDGGVTNRVFGTLLTWMQEKTAPVFVVATANNIQGIPPEFQRAGRFDEMFFLDLPDEEQRREVFACLLNKKGRNPKDFDLILLSQASDKYSPAELEKGINNALFIAYADDKRDMTNDDIITELGKFMPLYNTRREELEEMRTWALGDDGVGGRARLANSTRTKEYSVQDLGRQIDTFDEDDI